MKLHVISNDQGKVLGTYKHTATQAGAPVFGGFTPLKGQSITEIDVPETVFGIEDASELHKALEKHLQN